MPPTTRAGARIAGPPAAPAPPSSSGSLSPPPPSPAPAPAAAPPPTLATPSAAIRPRNEWLTGKEKSIVPRRHDLCQGTSLLPTLSPTIGLSFRALMIHVAHSLGAAVAYTEGLDPEQERWEVTARDEQLLVEYQGNVPSAARRKGPRLPRIPPRMASPPRPDGRGEERWWVSAPLVFWNEFAAWYVGSSPHAAARALSAPIAGASEDAHTRMVQTLYDLGMPDVDVANLIHRGIHRDFGAELRQHVAAHGGVLYEKYEARAAAEWARNSPHVPPPFLPPHTPAAASAATMALAGVPDSWRVAGPPIAAADAAGVTISGEAPLSDTVPYRYVPTAGKGRVAARPPKDRYANRTPAAPPPPLVPPPAEVQTEAPAVPEQVDVDMLEDEDEGEAGEYDAEDEDEDEDEGEGDGGGEGLFDLGGLGDGHSDDEQGDYEQDLASDDEDEPAYSTDEDWALVEQLSLVHLSASHAPPAKVAAKDSAWQPRRGFTMLPALWACGQCITRDIGANPSRPVRCAASERPCTSCSCPGTNCAECSLANPSATPERLSWVKIMYRAQSAPLPPADLATLRDVLRRVALDIAHRGQSPPALCAAVLGDAGVPASAAGFDSDDDDLEYPEDDDPAGRPPLPPGAPVPWVPYRRVVGANVPAPVPRTIRGRRQVLLPSDTIVGLAGTRVLVDDTVFVVPEGDAWLGGALACTRCATGGTVAAGTAAGTEEDRICLVPASLVAGNRQRKNCRLCAAAPTRICSLNPTKDAAGVRGRVLARIVCAFCAWLLEDGSRASTPLASLWFQVFESVLLGHWHTLGDLPAVPAGAGPVEAHFADCVELWNSRPWLEKSPPAVYFPGCLSRDLVADAPQAPGTTAAAAAE